MTVPSSPSRNRSPASLDWQRPGEPVAETFGTSVPGQIQRHLLALRPQSFTASVMPILVGTAWGAAQSGALNLSSAVLAALCMVLGHGAGNLINDIHDDMTGNDATNTERIYPYSGGSRFIQNGVMSRHAMSTYAMILLGVAALPGLVLLVRHGWGVAGFGILLFGLLVLYHLPPVKLGYRGLAETVIALALGIVPVLMASWLQGGGAGWLSVLVSLPVAMWIANVYLINEIPDRDADARTGKRTFVVLFGVERARALHKAANGTAFAACLLLVLFGYLSVWGGIGAAIILGLGLRSANYIDSGDRERMTTAIKITLAVHALGSLWLTGWIALS